MKSMNLYLIPVQTPSSTLFHMSDHSLNIVLFSLDKYVNGTFEGEFGVRFDYSQTLLRLVKL